MRAPSILMAITVLGLAGCVAPEPVPGPAPTPQISDEALREYLLRTALEEVSGAASGCGGSQLADIPCRLFDAHGVREVQCQTQRALALAAAICPAPPPSTIADVQMPPLFTPPVDVFIPHFPPPPRTRGETPPLPQPPTRDDQPPPPTPNPTPPPFGE